MMRRALALLAASWACAGCPGGDTRVHTASWNLDGTLQGARAVDDRAGGRVTCTVDADSDSPVDPAPLMVLAAVSAQDGRRQPAVYLTVRGFHGAGFYTLGAGAQDSRGHAVVFDDALLPECAEPGDTRCFQASGDCTVHVERWELGEPIAPGVRNGEATGRFECARLEGADGKRAVALAGGSFACSASDWTASR